MTTILAIIAYIGINTLLMIGYRASSARKWGELARRVLGLATLLLTALPFVWFGAMDLLTWFAFAAAIGAAGAVVWLDERRLWQQEIRANGDRQYRQIRREAQRWQATDHDPAR